VRCWEIIDPSGSTKNSIYNVSGSSLLPTTFTILKLPIMREKFLFQICHYILLALLALNGCSTVKDPNSRNVLFEQVEGAVDDIYQNVSSKYYSGDLGDDRLGIAVTAFQKSVAGTELEADVNKLVSKVTEVSTLGSRRPKKDALIKAAKELVDAVAEVKKKLK